MSLINYFVLFHLKQLQSELHFPDSQKRFWNHLCDLIIFLHVLDLFLLAEGCSPVSPFFFSCEVFALGKLCLWVCKTVFSFIQCLNRFPLVYYIYLGPLCKQWNRDKNIKVWQKNWFEMVRACEEMYRCPVRRCKRFAIVGVRKGGGRLKKYRGEVIRQDMMHLQLTDYRGHHLRGYGGRIRVTVSW